MPSDEYPQVIANWFLIDELGSGYSGSIWRAQHLHTKQVVALKLQDIDHECLTNKFERNFYPLLRGGKGMPILYAAGEEQELDYLAISLLGNSLHTLFKKSKQETMDLRSVCCIAMQIIERLEFMHHRGILHRDIQLGNVTIGPPGQETTLFMIDFGFSKRYIDSKTGAHIPDSTKKRDFIGNYWFSSIGVHCRGKVPSRRDDLEALALMLIHMLTPNGLPWTRNGVPRDDAEHDFLKSTKRGMTAEELCEDLPNEFMLFLKYCRRLKFAEQPNYKHWRETFRKLAVSRGYGSSDAFIWPPPAPRVSRAPPARTVAPSKNQDMAKIIEDLCKLKLSSFDKWTGAVVDPNVANQNMDNAAKQIREGPSSEEQIIISSGSEDAYDVSPKVAKSQKLDKLTKRTRLATDNKELSSVVSDFVTTLQLYSKTLTREGFAFLEALHKQLADPSVFLQATSLRSSEISAEVIPAKLDVLARLSLRVLSAKNNAILGEMVREFVDVMQRGPSSARAIPKNGFAFLEGLAQRLNVLR
ncbi:kinase-like protein [Cylindrobasidium torrendii FP15055 ss-10]|uniref:Kinase-like protein n=1 Tax=Cylindrobasidium torrendii FP15055 ss-10 TaxID=1314674 RepID=A0A0D7B453_9AGAR|nr:kinase-like protein [Cylindrobasidium torrendii FP15055 ss-10]